MDNGVKVNEALRQRFAPHLDRPAAGGPTEKSGKSRAVPASVKLVSPLAWCCHIWRSVLVSSCVRAGDDPGLVDIVH